MGFFKTQNNNSTDLSPREALERKYNNARNNLLLVVAFTVINILLAFTGGESYFLFSAAIPYAFVLYGLVLCGKMPEEWYEGETIEFLDSSVLLVLTLLAAAILVVYTLCWLFSKKSKSGWLIAALVLFAIDTVGMFFTGLLYDLSAIIDILFHGWVLYYLVVAILTAKKIKATPAEEPQQTAPEGNVFEELETTPAENEIGASETTETPNVETAPEETPSEE